MKASNGLWITWEQSSVIDAASRNGVLQHTAFNASASSSQVMQMIYNELGITSNELFVGATMLDNVDVQDERQGNEWQKWVNAGSGLTGAFGLGTHLSISGSRPMYTGAREWAEQVAAGQKIATVLNYAGKALGVTSTIAAGAALYQDPSITNFIKFGASAGQLALKSNVAGFLISTGWTAFEASGGVEWAVDGVSGWFGGSKGSK
jgi:hypothetical protein